MSLSIYRTTMRKVLNALTERIAAPQRRGSNYKGSYVSATEFTTDTKPRKTWIQNRPNHNLAIEEIHALALSESLSIQYIKHPSPSKPNIGRLEREESRNDISAPRDFEEQWLSPHLSREQVLSEADISLFVYFEELRSKFLQRGGPRPLKNGASPGRIRCDG
ncbi:hypothetical protein TWF970_010795 [Orbilia oligospora]|uniref:Uncharacterized protein n=1 Tax=Orbilia oligospora TaxID=2813651 RepID=A0A7C8R221_ORBOL|nr:hypothetical protein TWF970_010795 [Orbilia oligospora]